MINTTLLIINSKDRSSGTTSNFNYGFEPKTRVDKYRINKITVPYSWYNIKNQTFEYFDGIVTNTISFPEGSYTISTLQTKLSSLLPAITITYDGNTNKYTFTSATAFIITWQYGPGMLGTLLQAPITPLVFTFISGMVNLNLTSNIYLSSAGLTTYFSSIFNKKKNNVVLSIPIDVNSFNYIIFENQVPTYFAIDDRTLANLDIQILDDYGEVINLNGLDITIEIELYSTTEFL